MPLAPARPTDIPLVEHRLDNGLRVVVNEDHAVPLAAVNIWYRVGSRDEPKGRTGFAHLFEHLMFEGSRHVARGEHISIVEQAGGQLNASTTCDRTNYYETLPSNHVETALWLEADRMGTLLDAVDGTNLENQRAVVRNERLQNFENRPGGDAGERLFALLFPEGHPYRHQTIGSLEDIDAATVDDVHRFFCNYYMPSNAVLTVSGDVDTAEVLDWVVRCFGPIPANGGAPSPLDGALPLRLEGTPRQVVADPRMPLPRVTIAYRCPPDGTPEHDALLVAATVLGSGAGSRMRQELVVRQGLAVAAKAELGGMVGDVSFAAFSAVGQSGTEVDVIEAALARLVEGLAGEPPLPAEMSRAHGILRLGKCSELDRLSSRADALSRAAAMFNDPHLVNTNLADKLAVSVDRVVALAEEVFAPENRAVLAYVPGLDPEVASK